MIFQSSAATWRDLDNVNKQWRKVRDDVGVPFWDRTMKNE